MTGKATEISELLAPTVAALGLELLGVEFDELRCDVEFAHATEDVELTDLVIADGHVAAMDDEIGDHGAVG